MDFLNESLVKIVPEALGNAESDCPAVVYVQKLSAKGASLYAKALKEKDIKTNDALFCLIVEKIENFFLVNPVNDFRTEAKTPEEVVDIPGISPLILEVIDKFYEINTFSGQPKNVQ